VEDEDCHFDVLEPSKEIDIVVFTKTKQNKTRDMDLIEDIF